MPVLEKKQNRFIAVALIIYVVVLGCLAATIPSDQFTHLFSEKGSFEICSIVFWLTAAAALLARMRPLLRIHFAISLLCILCAMREADWHKKFTAGGIFKLKYYSHTVAPLTEKLLAAGVAALFFSLMGYILYTIYRKIRSSQLPPLESYFMPALGMLFFVISKILDRSSSLLHKSFDIVTSDHFKRYMMAYEEGLEMLTPLLFTVSFLSQKQMQERASFADCIGG